MTKPKSQTKKAAEARKWRVNAREKKRFNTLTTEYVHVKYKHIYEECYQLYQTLNEKYPDANNLTKTRTFKRIVEDHNQQLNEVEPARGDESVPDEVSDTVNEPVPGEVSDTVNEPVPGEVSDTVNEPVPGEVSDTVNEPVPDEVNDTTNESVVADERAQPDNILTIALQETLASHDYGDVNQNFDSIIDDIINDLEQDTEVRDLLNDAVDIMAHEMFGEYDDQIPPMDMEEEDEGIGLNLEAEIELDIEPLDFDLEVELFDL